MFTVSCSDCHKAAVVLYSPSPPTGTHSMIFEQGDLYSTSEQDRMGERLTLSRQSPGLRNSRGGVSDSNNPWRWLTIILPPFEIWCKPWCVKSRAHSKLYFGAPVWEESRPSYLPVVNQALGGRPGSCGWGLVGFFYSDGRFKVFLALIWQHNYFSSKWSDILTIWQYLFQLGHLSAVHSVGVPAQPELEVKMTSIIIR